MRALLASTQRNDRARTVFESQLGEILSHRLGEAQDDEVMAAELRGLWQATADSEVTAPIVRIRKATSLARVDAVEGNWDSAAEHYRTAIGLFTELGPATWRRADRVSQLPKVFAVASKPLRAPSAPVARNSPWSCSNRAERSWSNTPISNVWQ